MPTSADTALQLAITQVATVFGGMAAYPDEAGCGNCYSDAELTALKNPAVDLPADLVQAVSTEVTSHWDHPADVIRRVLPQIVVLMANGSTWPERIVCQWVDADWTNWADPQVQAVTGFFDAWLNWTLGQDSPPTPAREVFISCATATSSATEWIARWEASTAPQADHHLADAADWWRSELIYGNSPFHFWSGTPAQDQAACATLRTWLASRNLLAFPDESH